MDMAMILRGIVLGFSIAAPVGPIGVLCIRRTLAQGSIVGLISGLGAATADAIYGSIAGFGLTFVSSVLIQQQAMLRFIGGVFLCYLGVRTFLSRSSGGVEQVQENGLIGAYVSTFLLTLTNPMTILSFAGIFAGLGIADTGGDYVAAGMLIGGVFLGSALWWLTLSGSVGLLRTKFTPQLQGWVNRISGVVIAAFGLLALIRDLGIS
jgi:threonine/homoserine/homoserine lactone efflux protein